MYSPSGQMPRSPSPRMSRLRDSLSIRTLNQPAQPIMQPAQTSSQQRPYPNYPLPIPAEKQAKALKLYNQYRIEEGLAQRLLESPLSQGYPDGSYLNVPHPSTAYSVTSRTSSGRQRGTSVSTSIHEAATDLSSVVSFGDNESPSSLKAKAQGELLSYNGKKVKQRVRKRLSPTVKAKAALVRWLGSCWVCRGRRVPCPLEHHDIESLERLRNLSPVESRPPPYHSRSSASSSSRQTVRSTLATQQAASGGSQADFLGLGQNPRLLQPFGPYDTTYPDALSPGGADPLAEIPTPTPSIFCNTSDLSTLSPDPYVTYQNGQMIALGLRRNGYFSCQHLGVCPQYLNDEEDLQLHFARDHFPFTRIDPAHRYICPNCHHPNEYINGPCSECRNFGPMELWIYGNFIRTPSIHHDSPDGQDLQTYTSSADFFYPSAYGFSSMDPQWRRDTNDGNFGNGVNPGHYMNGPDGNTYGGPGNQAYNYNGSDSGGNQFQGNMFRGAWQMAKAPFNIRKWCAKAVEIYRRQEVLLLSLLLLFAITSCFTHEWIVTKARTSFPHASTAFRASLPTVGFMSMIGSFAMSFCIKHISRQPSRQAKCRPARCPFHALTPLAVKYRQSTPSAHISCGGCL